MSKKQTIVVKILSFALILTCFSSLLWGCSKPNEAEFLSEVSLLLEAAEKVNALCFGEGLAEKEGGYSVGSYTEAAEESLSAYGVANTGGIKEKIRAVYSVTTVEWIEGRIFSATYEDNSVLTYSRYYDTEVAEQDGNRPVLMVKKDYDPLLNCRAAYSNVRVSSLSSRRAEILVDVTVTKDGESRVEKDISLALRFEENGWRFDTPTYVNY